MKALAGIFLALCHLALSASEHLSGTWIACYPNAPWAYTLLSVDKDGNGYRWLAEWGQPYTASGAAHWTGTEMVLRGCRSYRGEADRDCDSSNPPVFTSLTAADYRRVRNSITDDDLRTGRWVRVRGNGSEWEKLAGACEESITKRSLPR